jgi:hypothetical protein
LNFCCLNLSFLFYTLLSTSFLKFCHKPSIHKHFPSIIPATTLSTGQQSATLTLIFLFPIKKSIGWTNILHHFNCGPFLGQKNKVSSGR